MQVAVDPKSQFIRFLGGSWLFQMAGRSSSIANQRNHSLWLPLD